MSAVEVLALALMASVALSASTLFIAPVAERISDDPLWRDRLWSAAFWTPVAAPVLTALFLLLPSPQGEPMAVAAGGVFQAAGTVTPAVAPSTARAAIALWIDWTPVAVVALAVAGLLSAMRLGQLVLRARRLARLIGRSAPASPELAALIDGRPGARPDLRVSDLADEAFLAGLRRPVLVVPESLTGIERGAVMAVVAHELAHLRRKDLIALWLEEAARVVLAGNPLLPVLHARRSLAREEACDALALAGASAQTRRLYARALIDAFRHRAATPTPGLALTFTGNKGHSAMRRIKSVLEPRPAAGRLVRRLSLAAAVVVGGAVCAGSLALAGQREGERPVSALPVHAGDAGGSDAALAAQGVDQASAQAAWDRLSPEQQSRLRDPDGTDFRAICGSDDPADVGYCMGVILAAMSDESVGRAACASPDDHAAVMRAKAAVDQVPSWPEQRPVDVAKMAVMTSSPCGATSEVAFNAGTVDLEASPPAGLGAPPPGGGRLWVRFDGDDMLTDQGDQLILTLTGQGKDGARYEHVSKASTGPNGELPDMMFVDLTRDYFPGLGERRAYELSARIQRGDKVVYVSDVSTIRLAPMSRGSLGRLRPVLEMRPA